MLDMIKWVGSMKKYCDIVIFLGILTCLAGAGLMFEGAILGETTTNVATVLGITGICLIATQRRALSKGGE